MVVMLTTQVERGRVRHTFFYNALVMSLIMSFIMPSILLFPHANRRYSFLGSVIFILV